MKTDDAYDPNRVQVNVVDTASWTNEDTASHAVTSDANAQPDCVFDSSPNLSPMLAQQKACEQTFEAGE